MIFPNLYKNNQHVEDCNHMFYLLNKNDSSTSLIGIFLIFLTFFSAETNGLKYSAIEYKVQHSVEFESELKGDSKWNKSSRLLRVLLATCLAPRQYERYIFPDFIPTTHRLLKLVILPSRAPPLI